MNDFSRIKTVEQQLQYLEEHIDERHLENVIEKHKRALNFETVDELPVRKWNFCGITPRSIEEIHKNPEDMMFNELIGCIDSVNNRDDSLPMIRANFGVGTFASLFGVKCVIVNGSMPWAEHLESEKEIEALIERGIPDLNNGFGKKLTEVHDFYKSKLAKYPKCQKWIRIYHSDLQGPFDSAHLIWGSGIYMDMYDNEKLFHRIMELMTDTYIKFMERELYETNAEIDGGYNFHWAMLYKGRLLLREDSSVNISRDMYIDMIQPYNRKIAEHFGSISMHFCGRADHWVKDLIKTPNIDAVNFGYMGGKFDNDFLKFIKEDCFDEKVAVIAYHTYAGFDRGIFPTGISLVG